MRSVLAAPDKFKGTASAKEVAAAIAAGAERAGLESRRAPLSDGGEGFLDVFGGPNRRAEVTGPLGETVSACWRLEAERRPVRAVIESAEAAGLSIAGGAEGNDPVAATTQGVGELIAIALDSGAAEIIIGCGGSATTDGGSGALQALAGAGIDRAGRVHLVAAFDVFEPFTEAARRFAPQKGADPAEVELLEERLTGLVSRYRRDHGVDVSGLAGSGSAGGLAGALAAIGAELRPGFEVAGSEVDLGRLLGESDAVVTGEGAFDEESTAGKVVGSLGALAAKRGVPALCVAGRVTAAGRKASARSLPRLEIVSLEERYDTSTSLSEPLPLVEEVVASWLEGLRA